MIDTDQIPEFVRGDFVVSQRDITVEWGHCDPAGIVFHPRFIEYFDWSCAVLFETATGLTKSELARSYGFAGWPILDLHVKFLNPVTYDDRVQIYSTISALKRSSFEVRHCLTRNGEPAVECSQKRVWCVASDPANQRALKSAPIPDAVVAKLKSARR
jgi:4-hydroxybenzoyl-CoA thioesterase